MTLRTVTYDDSKFKIVPIEPTEAMIKVATNGMIPTVHIDSISSREKFMATYRYGQMIAAAPEYQDTCTDGGKCGIGGYCESCTKEPTKDE